MFWAFFAIWRKNFGHFFERVFPEKVLEYGIKTPLGPREHAFLENSMCIFLNSHLGAKSIPSIASAAAELWPGVDFGGPLELGCPYIAPSL